MDPRDFLALTGYGTVGSLLVALGLLGCLLHRQSTRMMASAMVALTGVAVLLVGAQQFHGDSAAVSNSLAVVACGTAITFFLRSSRLAAESLTDESRSDATDSSTPDSIKSGETASQPAKAD